MPNILDEESKQTNWKNNNQKDETENKQTAKINQKDETENKQDKWLDWEHEWSIKWMLLLELLKR